jgi:hypothetical protein
VDVKGEQFDSTPDSWRMRKSFRARVGVKLIWLSGPIAAETVAACKKVPPKQAILRGGRRARTAIAVSREISRRQNAVQLTAPAQKFNMRRL